VRQPCANLCAHGSRAGHRSSKRTSEGAALRQGEVGFDEAATRLLAAVVRHKGDCSKLASALDEYVASKASAEEELGHKLTVKVYSYRTGTV
jgi:hypothetical protein